MIKLFLTWLPRPFNGERISSVQLSSVAQSCPTLCDPVNHSIPGLPVHHQLPEFTQVGRSNSGASQVALVAKNTPASAGDISELGLIVQPLGWEDPLEEGMTTHSSILAWRTPRTEELSRLRFIGPRRVRHD